MTAPLRAVLVEDSETDAKLILQELRQHYDPVHLERVDEEPLLRALLQTERWDVVMCDWRMPKFSALAALELVRDLGLDIPFIIVSGTIGEEAAVGAMRAGAHDYVLKDNLTRLSAAIDRERGDCETRAARRQADLRLADQSRLLEAILASIPDGVVVADQTGKFIHWNPAAGDLIGMGPKEGSPASWSSDHGVFATDQVTRVPAHDLPMVRALSGQRVDGMELFIRNEAAPDGRWVSVNATPLLGESGGASGGVTVFRDITEQRSARAQVMAADRMASVGLIAASVAHEINNPLASVLANVTMALADLRGLSERFPIAPDLIEMLSDASSSAERLRLIVRDLRILSRSDEDCRGPVDIRSVLESTLRVAWNEIRYRARIVKDYGHTPCVEANDSRLGQVFLNLIVNAAQAIPEGNASENEIRITTYTDDSGRSVVEIADTGSGISAELGKTLFTPFVTTKSLGNGTGLGLTICRRIVTGFGGEISFESEVGKGTTFRVTLPGAKIESVAQPPAAPKAATSMRRGRLCVVDDEELVGNVVRRVLASQHDVTVFVSAQQAREAIANGAEFDAILCDLMMPQMTGMDLFSEIRRIKPGMEDRMIFVTGGVFTPSAREFLDSVANHRLEKPFDVQGLRALVNGFVDQHAG